MKRPGTYWKRSGEGEPRWHAIPSIIAVVNTNGIVAVDKLSRG